MLWPIPMLPDGRFPVISSGFGPRKGTPPHAGADIDYEAAEGDPPWPGKNTNARTRRYFMPDGVPVLAFADGIVVQAAVKPRINGDVWVHHPNVLGPEGTGSLVTRYAHLRDLRVKVGQRIAEGTTLGIVHHGVSAFRHVHFEVLTAGRRGSQVDPLPLLKGAGVRKMSGEVVPRRPRGRARSTESDKEGKGATPWLMLPLLLVVFTRR